MPVYIIILVLLGMLSVVSLFTTVFTGEIGFFNISAIIFSFYTIGIMPVHFGLKHFVKETLSRSNDQQLGFGKQFLYTSILPLLGIAIIMIIVISYAMILQIFE